MTKRELKLPNGKNYDTIAKVEIDEKHKKLFDNIMGVGIPYAYVNQSIGSMLMLLHELEIIDINDALMKIKKRIIEE